ncbi:MAG: polysaccharide deacetylase family protein [Haloarculaceae archaeon]
MSRSTPTAVLSVDVELFDQTPAYRSARGTTDSEGVGLEGLEYLLETLDRHDAGATHFVVSSAAERYPDAVRRIADAGHEVGSHSHSHRLLSECSTAARREEYERSRELLRDLTGQPVRGFRAPAFDIPPGHFEGLDRAGYAYDASVVASRAIPGWYGGEYDLNVAAPASEVEPGAPAGLMEVPTSVMPGLRLPLTGTWLRFFGPRYTILGMRLLARRGVAPVLYVHPWELVDLPAVDGVPRRVYWHTGQWMRRAVDRILDQPFDFTTAAALAGETGLADDGGPRTPHGRD